MFRYLTLIFSLWTFAESGEKWHTSQTTLIQLYELQKEHFNAFDGYINAETKRLEELKNYLTEIYKWYDRKMLDKNPYCSHINGFIVMKQIQLRMRKINSLMINKQSADALKIINSDKDLSGDHVIFAIKGLVRLQKFYEIPVSDMVAGRHKGRNIGDQLNACECYVISLNCFATHDIYGSLDWAIQAHDKWITDGCNYTTEINSSNETRYSEKDENYMRHVILMKNDVLLIDRNESKSSLDITYGLDANRFYEQCPFANKFKDLCTLGESTRTLTKYSKCRYQTKNSTHRLLMPFKEEDISDDPSIKIYHDVLYDDEIETIKTMSIKNMVDSRVVDSKMTGGNFNEKHRSGKTSRIKNIHGSLNARIESFTGRNTQTAEDYQIVNYGLCGHYMPHYDVFSKKHSLSRQFGNRLMTVLFYLNDVQKDGYTVFPMLNIVSPAEKGAALVWYNMHTSDGRDHQQSLHGSCPLLKGNKWIMTRWLYEEGQDLPYNWRKLQSD
ncbi:Hypothetical protein CINCED_3A000530 [Cinara cedri]|uniref:procollagen-proline 4-dioxygenase n=1 Tax=Cinara cedri TaxID=506608 RepID=A0A5E4MPL1_9HEMI|nr:Hypothetical protein CINCED_3A000530 [Cinara cedri]